VLPLYFFLFLFLYLFFRLFPEAAVAVFFPLSLLELFLVLLRASSPLNKSRRPVRPPLQLVNFYSFFSIPLGKILNKSLPCELFSPISFFFPFLGECPVKLSTQLIVPPPLSVFCCERQMRSCFLGKGTSRHGDQRRTHFLSLALQGLSFGEETALDFPSRIFGCFPYHERSGAGAQLFFLSFSFAGIFVAALF